MNKFCLALERKEKMDKWGVELVAIILLVGLLVAQAAGNEEESVTARALAEFKRRLRGAGEILPSWQVNASVPSYCEWEGVICKQGRVVELVLPGKDLQGTITPFLSNLTFLRTLELSENHLTGEIPSHLPPRLDYLSLAINHLHGPIPPSISSLSRLNFVDLQDNSLNGSVPTQLSNCTQLQYLHLGQNNLSGSIPATLGDIPLLEVLQLYINSFSGPIPSSLGNCTHMLVLDISENELNGSIPPELGVISFTGENSFTDDFNALDLARNSFTGEIPFALGNCSGLVQLYLDHNKLQGSIPEELGKLTNLQHLYLSVNQLTGHIPPSLDKLAHLQRLFLDYNYLIGPIPEGLTNLTNLTRIDLGGNRLEGPLPQGIGALAALQSLHLQENKLSGILPPSLARCIQLQDLNVRSNTFNGPLPSFFSQLPHLQTLDLSRNQFTGSLPSTSFINASALFMLFIAQTNISGPIPSVLGTLSSLQLLDLHGNQLKGPIPSELSRCTQLFKLDLHSNSLRGPLPLELGQLSKLQHLYLQWNALQGEIPHSLGNCYSLLDVDLSHNSFTGSIPNTLFTLSSLSIYLNLSHNLLTGTIPNEVRNLKSIQSIDFSSNKLSGAIPATFSECIALEALNISHNSLNGSIPGALGHLQNLGYLDLSANKLSGELPDNLGEIPELHFLNVSQNQLVDSIPASLGDFTAASFSDNPGLCGPPLTVRCRPVAKWEVSKSALAAIICGIVGAVLIFSALVLWCSKHQNVGRHMLYQGLFKNQGLLHITAEELEVATRGFDEENLLGSGGTSKVYKAKLKDGLVVAVKKFNLESSAEAEHSSFRKECEILGKMKHRNLVKIWGTCCNLDMKALVLEYMPNGSLEKLLFASDSFELGWNRVLNIALDVGQALVYMHHECHLHVVHCDLKPSNILLDEVFTAHVSDFGIATLLGPDTTSHSTSSFKGSIGYMAPECAELSRYSDKGDMYSYGVVLLCMLTQKQPTSEHFAAGLGIDMPTWIRRSFPDRFLEALSPALRNEVEDAGKQEEVRQLMEVGLICTARNPKERLTSKEVVKRLLQIKGCKIVAGNLYNMETLQEPT